MDTDDVEGVMARMLAESPRAVVEVTLADESLIKHATAWLEARGRPADAEAAARLVLAHARREAAPWVIAQLLTCVPHPIGLTAAVALLAEEAFGADSCAAEALAAMGDRSVAPTLEALLLSRTDVDATRGAARALAGLLGRDAVPVLRQAFRAGRIPARTVGVALARADVTDATLASWLRSDATDRALALEALHHRLWHVALWRKGIAPTVTLGPLVRAALADAGGALLASERERIEAWLADAPPSPR